MCPLLVSLISERAELSGSKGIVSDERWHCEVGWADDLAGFYQQVGLFQGQGQDRIPGSESSENIWYSRGCRIRAEGGGELDLHATTIR